MLAFSAKLKLPNPGIEKPLFGIFAFFPLLVLGLFLMEKYLLIAIIFVTIFLVLIFQNYRYGLYFIVIGLPLFQSISTRSDAATTTGINLQYILIPVVFVAWLSEKILNKELSTIKLPYFALVSAFVVTIFLSIFNQVDVVSPGHIKHGVIQAYAFVNYLLLFYIIINENLTREDIQRILWGFLIVAFITAVIGIYQYLTIKGHEHFAVRITSVFGSIFRDDTKDNPNDFGAYLAFMIMVAILVWNITEKKNRVMVGIIAASIFLALLLSFSRSSLLAAIFAILCYTFYQSKKVFMYTIIIVAIGLIVLYFEPRFQSRINSIYEILTNKRIVNIFLNINPQNINWEYVEYYGIQGYGSDIISGAFRFWAWVKGIQLFGAHPFLGIGYHLTLAFSPWPTSENLYLDFVSMTGLVGFLIFIAIQIKFIKDGFRLLKSPQFTHIGMFWLTILATAFFASLTGSVLFSGKLLGIFWIIAGIFYNVRQKENHNFY